jgi:hypothetical protein
VKVDVVAVPGTGGCVVAVAEVGVLDAAVVLDAALELACPEPPHAASRNVDSSPRKPIPTLTLAA